MFLIELIGWYAFLFFAVRQKKEGLLFFSTVAIIVATIETTQTVEVFGIEMIHGSIPFACLFLATDIASELYGKDFSRKVVAYSGVGLVLVSLFMFLSCRYEGIAEGFVSCFAVTPRIGLSSISVYLICSYLDVFLYHFIGERSKYKWIRNNICTITSQFANAFLFVTLAFGFNKQYILMNFAVSAILALLDTPMLYLITGKDRKL